SSSQRRKGNPAWLTSKGRPLDSASQRTHTRASGRKIRTRHGQGVSLIDEEGFPQALPGSAGKSGFGGWLAQMVSASRGLACPFKGQASFGGMYQAWPGGTSPWEEGRWRSRGSNDLAATGRFKT